MHRSGETFPFGFLVHIKQQMYIITQFVKTIDCFFFFISKTEVRPLRDTLRVFLQVKQILNLTRFYLRSWKKVAEHAKLFNSNWLSL